MARNKRIYNKTIAISQEDEQFVQEIRMKDAKRTKAGTLAMMINYYRTHYDQR